MTEFMTPKQESEVAMSNYVRTTCDADGVVQYIKLHDVEDGTPAVRLLRPDGSAWYEEHWQYGKLHDSADGTAARRWLNPNGSVRCEEHWQEGVRVP